MGHPAPSLRRMNTPSLRTKRERLGHPPPSELSTVAIADRTPFRTEIRGSCCLKPPPTHSHKTRMNGAPGEGKSPFSLDSYLSWMSPGFLGINPSNGPKSPLRKTKDLYLRLSLEEFARCQ